MCRKRQRICLFRRFDKLRAIFYNKLRNFFVLHRFHDEVPEIQPTSLSRLDIHFHLFDDKNNSVLQRVFNMFFFELDGVRKI